MILWLGVVGITVAGIAAITKMTGVLGRSPDPARRALWFAILTVGLAMAGHLPPVYETINSVAGFNLSWPIQRLTVIISAYFSQLFFLYAVNRDDPAHVRRRRIRVRHLAVLAASVAIVIPFLLRPEATDFVLGPAGRHEAGGPGDSIAQLAQVAFAVYMVWAESSLLLIARRWARKCDRGALHTGLLILAVGYGLSTVMVLHSLGYHLVLLIGAVPAWPEAVPTMWLIPLTSAAQLGGVLVPTLWPQLVRLRRWIAHRRALTVLYPLWSSMVSAVPEVALDPDPGRWRDRLRVWDVKYRLRRRVIEIWDVRSKLSDYLPADVDERARRAVGVIHPDDGHQAAAVEATVIGIGLHALRHGHQSSLSASVTPGHDRADLAAEVAWWRRVAIAFRRIPITVEARDTADIGRV